MTTPESQWTSSDLLLSYVTDAEEIDPRLKKSFARLREVCDEICAESRAQAKRGARFSNNPIYIAEVGRRCKAKFGGPSAESISRNRSTEPLKATYIELRASELELPGLSENSRDPLALVGDSGVRAYIRTLESRIKVDEELIRGLTTTLKSMRPVSLDVALAAASEQDDQLEIATGRLGMPRAGECAFVIRKLLDSSHLASFGLEISAGIFNPATGEELLSEEEVEVLKELVGIT